ncbi:hypothetical protein J2Y45_000069 [Dyadobacter sp. BE34]|uniref:Uncharacterized protein n=1 Tax=Dyadobacter fermentans TaxID=94254 RepID=A0ABU1R7C7_9BACT|nr:MULTISPECIES: hypothetical protein [Dyadobacter]MDR6809316.1 hypothetical protein [Dyadobacter fermentans]MDR7047090.1 hypothetical protein [Dyadobacter sp. BE242]MDR7194943.1 hypothetical protein [Dyadobacter sp. BE34]MDR7214512.1 hypothetical protein [Dyadobacter sp. BE31]MDR7266865.1 hypothetical protein [Dyadobacter sp. BE32]
MGGEGDILYFDLFYFKNDNAPKAKYFIVLKTIGASAILASLPSSRDFRPTVSLETYGCIEVPEACFNCFVFKAGLPVTANNWAFPLDTFVYGQQIDEYEIAVLKDIYPVEGLDYKVVGRLKDAEFKDLKDCFCQSASVKRRFRRLLASD